MNSIRCHVLGTVAVVAALTLAVAAPADAQNRRGLNHWEGRRLTQTFNRHAQAPVRREAAGGAKQPKTWRKGDLTHTFNGRRPPTTARPQHNLNPPRVAPTRPAARIQHTAPRPTPPAAPSPSRPRR